MDTNAKSNVVQVAIATALVVSVFTWAASRGHKVKQLDGSMATVQRINGVVVITNDQGEGYSPVDVNALPVKYRKLYR